MGTFNDLLIEIGIDTRPAMKEIEKLDKTFDKLGKSFTKAVSKRAPKDPFNLGAERTRMQKYIRELKDLGAETEQYQKRLKGLKNASQFKEMQKDLAKYKRDFIAFKDAESKDNMRNHKAKSQAELSRENALKKQKILLKQVNDLGLKPQNNALDSIAKQNTALERQIKQLEKRNREAAKFERNVKLGGVYQGASDSQRRSIDQRVGAAAKEFKLTGDKEVFQRLNKDLVSFKRNMIGLQTVQGGLTDSTRNMVRAYASLFALVEGTTAIVRIGMDFESVRASMLAASDTQDDATKKLKFVREEARRLGVDLVAASKAYMQLSIAGKDLIDNTTIDKLFVTTMEAATAFGMSLDDTKGTFRAFIQMLSKGNVQAEELRGQLGERLYGAFNLAAKSLGKTTSELNKMLEQGQVLAKDLIPAMIPNIQKLARNNGALEKQLESTRTAQNRFIFDVQSAADKVFQSGFSQGLKELYATLSDEIDSTGGAQENLGNIFDKFFKAVAAAVKVLTPALESLLYVVSKVVDGWTEIFKVGGTLLKTLEDIDPALRNSAESVAILALAFKSLYAQIYLGIAALTELLSLFDDKIIGKFEATMGKQVNFSTMTQQKVKNVDGKFYSSGKKEALSIGMDDLGKITEDPMAITAAAATTAALIYALNKLRLAIIALTTKMSTGVNNISTKAGKYSKGAKGLGAGLGIGSLFNPATAAAAAITAPVTYSAYKMSQNPEASLESIKDSGMYSGRLAFADRMTKKLEMQQQSQTTTQMINISGLEVPITIVNPSDLDEARTAGQVAGDAFKTTLEDRLSSLIKGGR